MGRLADIENQVTSQPVVALDCVVESLENENEDETRRLTNENID
jgi:hypothetical protein